MQLCDAFDLPILFLCDTPGIMVGPEVEKTALVRHAARMFVVGAQPDGAVLHDRAAQGLRPRRAGDGGRQLQGAAVHASSWPTGEFGGMGLEGAVKLGFRKELAAIAESRRARARCSTQMVARIYERRQGGQHGVRTSRSTT